MPSGGGEASPQAARRSGRSVSHSQKRAAASATSWRMLRSLAFDPSSGVALIVQEAAGEVPALVPGEIDQCNDPGEVTIRTVGTESWALSVLAARPAGQSAWWLTVPILPSKQARSVLNTKAALSSVALAPMHWRFVD